MIIMRKYKKIELYIIKPLVIFICGVIIGYGLDKKPESKPQTTLHHVVTNQYETNISSQPKI